MKVDFKHEIYNHLWKNYLLSFNIMQIWIIYIFVYNNIYLPITAEIMGSFKCFFKFHFIYINNYIYNI